MGMMPFYATTRIQQNDFREANGFIRLTIYLRSRFFVFIENWLALGFIIETDTLELRRSI